MKLIINRDFTYAKSNISRQTPVLTMSQATGNDARKDVMIVLNRIVYIIRRELKMYRKRPLFLYGIILMPVLCIIFTSLSMRSIDSSIVRTHISTVMPLSMRRLSSGCTVCCVNALVIGVMVLLIMLTTVYAIGLERKTGQHVKLYIISGRSPFLALSAKLLPPTVIYTSILFLMGIWGYRFCGCSCNGNIFALLGISILIVVSSQGLGIFVYGLMAGRLPITMWVCSMWGALPLLIMCLGSHKVISLFARSLYLVFPLKHYIYMDSVVYGCPLADGWPSVMAVLISILMPVFVLSRYRRIFGTS